MIPVNPSSVSSTSSLFEDSVHPYQSSNASESHCDYSFPPSPIITTPGNEYKIAPASKDPPSTAVLKDIALLTDEVLHAKRLNYIRDKKGYIIDMDGVIYHVSFERPIV
jgi:hypothetical protein